MLHLNNSKGVAILLNQVQLKLPIVREKRLIYGNFTYQTLSRDGVSTDFKYQGKMNVRGFEHCRHYRDEDFMKENNWVVDQVWTK